MRAAAQLIRGGRRLLGRLQAAVPDIRGVTFLAYHLVGAGADTPVDLPLPIFRAQMEALRRSGRACTLEEAAARLAAGQLPRDSDAVVVTFDDAYENFFTHAYPVLEACGIPATLYVPTRFVEGAAPAPIRGAERLPPCSWSQLREMQAGGLVSIGSHTCTHPSLTAVSPLRAAWEIRTSREVLEDRLGTAVTSFCYPRALWTPRLEADVRRTYRTSVVGGGVKARPANYDPYRIRRISLRKDTPRELAPMLRSAVWLEEWIADHIRRARASGRQLQRALH